MRSLYIRILSILTTALILCLIVTFLESARISQVTTRLFFEGSMVLELRQAQRAYEEGGPLTLNNYLTEVNAAIPGQRFLTDHTGKDLVSGINRSDMLITRTNLLGLPKEINGRIIIVKSSADSHYYLVVIAPPPVGIARFIPYLLLIAVIIAIFGWLLAAGIVSPLRSVSVTVERFGRGDLAARADSRRKDEIGNLAHSFNSMAERIQTLLAAERRLLQDISHELRSPLARLTFATELMKDAPDPEAASGRIKKEVRRLTQLVGSLLEMTAAEGDPLSRKHERFALSEVLEETVDDCAFEMQARGVRLESDTFPPAMIDGDRELLRRAVENVLRNSLRYAPEGSVVTLHVDILNANVRIKIRDCGPGVPEEALSHMFDPFFRVDNSRTSETGGVGLGLAIAKRAILVHRGSITAKNEHPGLCISIEIPCAPDLNDVVLPS